MPRAASTSPQPYGAPCRRSSAPVPRRSTSKTTPAQASTPARRRRLRSLADTAARIRAAVVARRNPDFLIVARSDAFWISRDLEDCIVRLEAYAAAGADMIFPTAVGPAELAEVRRRIDKPIMIVDMPGRALDEHAGASIVLYYAFSTLVQFEALSVALRAFKSGKRPEGQAELENFLLSYLNGRGSSAAGR